MTDTGQIPGEGQPAHAGAQPAAPAAPGAYTFPGAAHGTSVAEEDLLMPGTQGAWSEAQAAVAPQQSGQPPGPLPGTHETDGRDSGSIDYGAVRGSDAGVADWSSTDQRSRVAETAVASGPSGNQGGGRHAGGGHAGPAAEPTAGPGALPAADGGGPGDSAGSGGGPSATAEPIQGKPAVRRPVHPGPPVPEQSGTVRSLAERGPSTPAGTGTAEQLTEQPEQPWTGEQQRPEPTAQQAPMQQPAPEQRSNEAGGQGPPAGQPVPEASVTLPQQQADSPTANPEYLDVTHQGPDTLGGPRLGGIPAQQDGWISRAEQPHTAPSAGQQLPEAALPGPDLASVPASAEDPNAQVRDRGAQPVPDSAESPSSAAASSPATLPAEKGAAASAVRSGTDHGAGGPDGSPADTAMAAPDAGPAAEAPVAEREMATAPEPSVTSPTPVPAVTESAVPAGEAVAVPASTEVPTAVAAESSEAADPSVAPVTPAPVTPAPAPVPDHGPGSASAVATDTGTSTGPDDPGSAVPEPVPQPSGPGGAAAGPGAEPSAGPGPQPVDPTPEGAKDVGTDAVREEPAVAQEITGAAGPASTADPEDQRSTQPAGQRADQPVEAAGEGMPSMAPLPVEEMVGAPEGDQDPTPAGATPADQQAGAFGESGDATVADGTGTEAGTAADGPAAAGFDETERAAVHRLMRERRDIRNGFRPDPVPHEVLLRVLEAAHTAPSVGHSQPWDFVVIRSEETRRSMQELAQRQREAYAKSLPKARARQFKELKTEAILDTPVNIVVTADPTRGGRHTLGRHTQPQMAPYSSALAVENLWLAARAEGLGVGWVSFFDEREMVRTLDLPEHLEVVAYLCVGYVDEFPADPELMQAGWSKRRPLSWVVHDESYGRRALPGSEPHDLLAETLERIRPLDAKALGEAWERQKRMTKPAGALGMLEIISAQLCGLSRQCPPPVPEPAAVAVFAGDHGVHAQGVTPWPQEVTSQMVANFLAGGAVCNAFAQQVGAEVCVVDVGVVAELPATPGLLPRKIRPGTADMTEGPALSREDVLRALEVGIETARDLVAAGNKALLTGEMGIANTTASAALIAVCTQSDPAEVTGRGAGISDDTHDRKVDVVRRALRLHQPDPADPVTLLATVGGLEHAALTGLILGAASLRTPVILDGVSAGAAALVARQIAPEALAACVAGHRSAEPGHLAALAKLGLRPLIDLDLRLGEGTGALLALPMVQSAARAMHDVATFDAAGVTEKN
ncbi:nicotinate-nucleotide--dimethylbenzimidazole phosphoribosyltransferase [Streptomyces oceani]|uniref:Nicotinate-nucleotide--dimethylbenzimidazole phosphoribosyltransferase n=1 Tax=Streptomyces oceani TaxID=1075402 RepID=A0A1E7JYQ6_9ACTN|nr:nicotinate-nucleotide--dimethylbenzimidazole phosphoribosyltransferase [Streptomyces oceani]OEU96726.1 hypothetical protein AN216_19060 [Streptomyces oceani]